MVEAKQKFLNVKDTATYLGLAPATLNRWRCQGAGPRWMRFGGSIRYGIPDLDEWAESQRRSSTGDTGAAA